VYAPRKPTVTAVPMSRGMRPAATSGTNTPYKKQPVTLTAVLRRGNLGH
jgi:hypothetical protein